jgi:hypothetical protein
MSSQPTPNTAAGLRRVHAEHITSRSTDASELQKRWSAQR